MPVINTVGISSKDWPKFKRLLDRAEVGVIADVRSNSVSRLPHFNRTALKERLNCAGVGYVFLGLELGGRARNGGVPNYEQMAVSQLFAEGIARVEELAARTRPALMCSEHEALSCHRCLLVGRRLVERGVGVAHILCDGTIEPHAQTEERLLALVRQTEANLFAPHAERLSRAHRAQELRLRRATDGTRRKPS